MIKKIHRQLVLKTPSFLRLPAQITPFVLQKKTLLEALKLVFKEALEDGDFEFLEGRCLKVSVTDVNLCWYISYQDEQLVVLPHSEQEDVSFSAGLNDLILIAGRKEDPDTLFFQRRLKIEGDTELGLEVKNLMDSVDLDGLPPVLSQLLQRLAAFVQEGMQPLPEKQEVINAH